MSHKATEVTPKLNSKPVFTLTLYNRTLQLTREGGGFVVLVLGVGLGAINTGNNLLYLILAMCCSLIAVSGVLSEITLRKLSVSIKTPGSFYAESPTQLFLTITNGKKKVPSYSLQIDSTTEARGLIEFENPLYLLHLPAGGVTQKTVRVVAHKRGQIKIRSLRVSTGFPFGFFVKSKTLPLDLSVLVFPPIANVQLPEPNEISVEGEGIIKARGDDLFALREFQTGDPLDNVHWKSSARTGSLRVKEFAAEGNNSFTIFLNLQNSTPDPQEASQLFEERVKESASLVYHLIRRGDDVRLKTRDLETPFGNSEQHLESIMKYLALIEMPTPDKKNTRAN